MARSTRTTPAQSHRARWARRAVSAMAAGALGLSLSSCGFGAQTLQPYTQAEGINLTVGSEDPTGQGVKLRNILIIADPESGDGFFSAAIVAGRDDKLLSITGQELSPDGETSKGTLNAELGQPLELPAGQLIVLTEGTTLSVTGAKLKPGFTAELEMVFAKAGLAKVTVPIVDGTKPDYVTLAPSPAASSPASSPGGSSASPSSSPSPSE